MHAATVTVQDDAEARVGRRAFGGGVYDALSGTSSALLMPTLLVTARIYSLRYDGH